MKASLVLIFPSLFPSLPGPDCAAALTIVGGGSGGFGSTVGLKLGHTGLLVGEAMGASDKLGGGDGNPNI
jgi:hypothetical protein